MGPRSDGRRDRVQVTYDEDARWLVVRRGRLHVICNLAGERTPHADMPYADFVENRLRMHYGLDGIPVIIDFAERTRKPRSWER